MRVVGRRGKSSGEWSGASPKLPQLTLLAALFRSFEKLFTKFLSLDKCLPRRSFLEILEIERPKEEQEKPVTLTYDTEWLAVLKKFQRLPYSRGVPNNVERPTADEIKWCESKIKSSNGGELTIPENFVKTTPTQRECDAGARPKNAMYGNPQTDRLLAVLELEHLGTVAFGKEEVRRPSEAMMCRRTERIQIDDHKYTLATLRCVGAAKRPE